MSNNPAFSAYQILNKNSFLFYANCVIILEKYNTNTQVHLIVL